MQATIGDRICIHGNCVGHPDKIGEIVEVHGTQGEPPYLVKFDDGHTRLIFPGPDAVIQHPAVKLGAPSSAVLGEPTAQAPPGAAKAGDPGRVRRPWGFPAARLCHRERRCRGACHSGRLHPVTKPGRSGSSS